MTLFYLHFLSCLVIKFPFFAINLQHYAFGFFLLWHTIGSCFSGFWMIKSSGKELFSNSCLLSSNCSLKKNLKNKMINRYFLFLNDPDFTKTFISIRFNIQNITKKPLYDKNFFIFSLLIWCHCSSVIYVTFDVIYCTLCSLVCFL